MDPHMLHHTEYMAHGFCLLWERPLVWLHVVADSFIALSYYSIPLMLLWLARRRTDLVYHWMFLMFAAFIFACGTTHVLSIVTLWKPWYWLDGLVKAATAAISFTTAVLLLPVVPRTIRIPGTRQLTQANEQLQQKIAELNQTQAQLQRYAIELERSNQELGEFAYVASHDLQEPLRMVTSYLQLLEARYRNQLSDEADEFIHFAVDGASRMQGLINDLLAYSRVTTRARAFSPVEMNEVLRRAQHNMQVAIAETGARIDADDLPRVNGDSTHLVQLLQNLLSNAIKFRGKQPPRVELRARREDDHWRFSLRDNGIGFDARYAEQAFMIFKRLHSNREIPGTGIGLAICRKIVERHGGRIWVESVPGEGTCFHFTLPAITVKPFDPGDSE